MDVGHSHKHHLTVGVVLYTQTHVNNIDGGQKTTTIVTLNDTEASLLYKHATSHLAALPLLFTSAGVAQH